MAGYYRLNELGFQLDSGSFVLKAKDLAPIAQATELLESAEERAREIVAEAQEIYRSEKERGHEEGLEDARLASIERLLKESHTLDQSLQHVEQDIAKVVVSCVRKLVDSFDEYDKAYAIVRHAMGQMRREKKAELRVPTQLYAAFRGSVDKITQDFPEVQLIDVVEDHNLQPSQVIVETSVGRVDGNLGLRLNDLELIIRRAYASVSASPSAQIVPASEPTTNSWDHGEDEDEHDFNTKPYMPSLEEDDTDWHDEEGDENDELNPESWYDENDDEDHHKKEEEL